jgi:hypothetical protein
MGSKPAPVADPHLFDGDWSGGAADRSRVTVVVHFDSSPNIERDVYRLPRPEVTVSTGTVLIGFLWLALYVIAVLHTLTSQHRAPASIPKMALTNVTAPP